MKTNHRNKIKCLGLGVFLLALTTGCNDLLDITPPANISPEDYLVTADQLAAYTIRYYANYDNYDANSGDKGGQLPSNGTAGESPLKDDVNTDNETAKSGSSNRFLPGAMGGSWKVGASGGNWNFSNIYALNFYLNTTLPRYENGAISGIEQNVKHYIGEGYFLRAHEYFYRLRKIGDFPIITEILPDGKEPLVEASMRKPRNEVARFILDDLDKAIELLLEKAPQGGKARISKKTAHLLRARVALFEGTWLKNHKGTAFVPGGPGWPGESKEYSKGYTYPSGTIDAEIDYFLGEAMKSAQIVADATSLAENNGIQAQDMDYKGNPYYDMFASLDPTSESEVLLARLYVFEVQTHWFNHYRWGGVMLVLPINLKKHF